MISSTHITSLYLAFFSLYVCVKMCVYFPPLCARVGGCLRRTSRTATPGVFAYERIRMQLSNNERWLMLNCRAFLKAFRRLLCYRERANFLFLWTDLANRARFCCEAAIAAEAASSSSNASLPAPRLLDFFDFVCVSRSLSAATRCASVTRSSMSSTCRQGVAGMTHKR